MLCKRLLFLTAQKYIPGGPVPPSGRGRIRGIYIFVIIYARLSAKEFGNYAETLSTSRRAGPGGNIFLNGSKMRALEVHRCLPTDPFRGEGGACEQALIIPID